MISAIEHPAIAQVAEYLMRLGYAVTIVGCDANGLVDPDDVRKAIRSDTRLVSIMHANNEVGTVQMLREIASICHERGVLVHTDAAQSVGKVRTKVDELDVDLLSLAGHKLYAPKGIGVLFVRQNVDLEPVLHGAGHEKGLRPGTENVPHIVGLGAAARLAAKEMDAQGDRLGNLRDSLCDTLRQAIGAELTVNGELAPRLQNTLSVNFPARRGPRTAGPRPGDLRVHGSRVPQQRHLDVRHVPRDGTLRIGRQRHGASEPRLAHDRRRRGRARPTC